MATYKTIISGHISTWTGVFKSCILFLSLRGDCYRLDGIMFSFHSIAYFAQNEGAGHFYHYHCAVQKAMELQLKDVAVYVPQNANFAETPSGWKKWFSPFYNRSSRKKFWKDCVRLFRQPTENPRIFFIEFFGRRDFVLYALAALLYARKQDIFWVLYRDDLTIRRKKDLKNIRLFSKLLKWKFKERFVPVTDSAPLADYYEGWFGKKPTVLPILYSQYQPLKVQKKEKLICTWLGSPRSEKGASEIAQLVQLQDPAADQIELDVSGATYFPPVKNHIHIHLRKAFLTEEEYYAALYRSDIILLPYDPDKYKRRTSGVFVEAIIAGKIPLVKEGSWLAYELKQYDLHELIIDWENPRLFSHIFTLIEDQNMLKKLAKMQQAYVAFHGEANFARSLHSLCPK